MTTAAIGLLVLLFLAAILYTSVGHAGASGYLAAMALYGLAPETIRPAALMLNILAASIAVIRFGTAGYLDRRLFIPLAIGSVPTAFVGGWLTVPGLVFKILLASALVVAAARLVWPTRQSQQPPNTMPVWAGILIGAGIGLLAGITSVGGGIYLTPLLLFAGWANAKNAAGVSAAFILVNSMAALIGRLSAVPSLPPELPVWAAAVLLGSLIGSTLGSRLLGTMMLRRLLAAVLLVAATKFLFA